MILVPKNWSSFQHYKDRNPPWIKLHKSLLEDRSFMRLPTASKALAPMLWLLASESKTGEFDASIDELEFRLRMSRKDIQDGLKSLIDNGFFVNASAVLADASKLHTFAVPETEREAETETEKEPKGSLSSQPAAERTPSQKLLDLFHEKCTYLPKVSVFNDARKRALKARFHEVMKAEKWTADQTIEWFGDFYQIANRSKFLTGRAPPGRDGRTFKADWDWIHNPTNFVKIIEGKYED